MKLSAYFFKVYTIYSNRLWKCYIFNDTQAASIWAKICTAKFPFLKKSSGLWCCNTSTMPER